MPNTTLVSFSVETRAAADRRRCHRRRIVALAALVALNVPSPARILIEHLAHRAEVTAVTAPVNAFDDVEDAVDDTGR